ncbi:hypothetical protein AGABI2DRAFT_132674 [Agaricus bisporus var. bisporus H97]|uniref:hypothetical protein n=1 Tax=Agaricus bisporus var. bisporus (strain H97 / ATCC MYA-4626 / FGSC 10389) TaxID=936046 RepID=UPI00029F51B1|nr:hypothetical protein AGABI2DRAFT_132674 [Agaricus bisporus var. bisporus H97]EKV50954.1 hypothetical protein AGABI2DRAFT_132674 [Agaricus bisporus var. bisporus H97]
MLASGIRRSRNINIRCRVEGPMATLGSQDTENDQSQDDSNNSCASGSPDNGFHRSSS